MNTNFNIEQLDLLELWRKKVGVVENSSEIEIYLTQSSLDNKYGKDKAFKIEMLIKTLERAIEETKIVYILGSEKEEIMFYPNQLMKIKEDVDTINLLIKYIENKISLESLLASIGKREIYTVAEIPTIKELQEGNIFVVKTVKLKGKNYEAIPVFFNKEHLEEYKNPEEKISKIKIDELMDFFDCYGIIIEPNYDYWVDIPPISKMFRL